MSPRKTTQSSARLSSRILLACAGIAAVALINYALILRPDRVVGMRAPVQFDDFAFEVLELHNEVLDGRSVAVLELRIHNHAVRVTYHFDPSIVSIQDADGRRFNVSPHAQKALLTAHSGMAACTGAVPAGATCTTHLAFELPAGIRQPTLVIRHGFWIGALIDDLLIGKKVIRLAYGDDPIPPQGVSARPAR
jgi:hypothetical protein